MPSIVPVSRQRGDATCEPESSPAGIRPQAGLFFQPNNFNAATWKGKIQTGKAERLALQCWRSASLF